MHDMSVRERPRGLSIDNHHRGDKCGTPMSIDRVYSRFHVYCSVTDHTYDTIAYPGCGASNKIYGGRRANLHTSSIRLVPRQRSQPEAAEHIKMIVQDIEDSELCIFPTGNKNIGNMQRVNSGRKQIRMSPPNAIQFNSMTEKTIFSILKCFSLLRALISTDTKDTL